MPTLRQWFSHLRPRKAHRSATRPVLFLGLERRLTNRRLDAGALPDRETRLRFAAQAAGFGIYDMDCGSGEIHWSPELKAIAGLPTDDSTLSFEQLALLLHPEDRDRVMEKISASLSPEGAGEFEDEHRLMHPDGNFRWVRAKGRTFFTGQDGHRYPVGATGIVVDITESRDYQAELAESRTRLAALIDSSTDAILSIDAEQRVTLFNPAACRMFRCRAEDVIGTHHDRFIPERYRHTHREHIRNFMEKGVTARAMGQAGTFLGLRQDGEEFPIEASISKVQVGGDWQMTVIIRDVTERKAAEKALKDNEELLRLANEAANIGTYDTDLESGRTRLSPEMCGMLGFDPCPELDLQETIDLVHPEDREAMLSRFRRSLDPAGDGLVRSEHRVVRSDGRTLWLVWRGRTLFREGPGGRVPVRNIGACFDITERKRLEEALQGMNEELEQRVGERTAELSSLNEELIRSNLELQQFAYIAAHDLQTPLRSITGFAQLLQKEFRGEINRDADVWIGQLVHHVERMHDLIHDLLVYSGAHSPGRPFESTDLSQVFGEAVADLAPAVRQSGATVTRDELPILLADRVQMAQVLQNLIENGIKYRSREPPRIHVSARRQGEEWIFSVADNGIGIAPKHHERIFEVFRRLHSQQAYPGTGIGLAICRRVVQRHGGSIWVESEPGKGSIFYFSLPNGATTAPGTEKEAND